MTAIVFKDYQWPQNPHTYRDEMRRKPYYELVGTTMEYTGMSPVLRSITGEGVFFGENAYRNYLALMEVFEEGSPGYLVHPIWGRCYCYFTRLELTQEPREGYVSYRFGFTGAQTNGEIPR